MKHGRRLAIIVTIGALAVGGALIGKKVHQSRIYNRFYSLTMQAADIDGSGERPGLHEMVNLYSEMGKRYDPSEKPEKPTIDEMKDYLRKKGVRADNNGYRIN